MVHVLKFLIYIKNMADNTYTVIEITDFVVGC